MKHFLHCVKGLMFCLVAAHLHAATPPVLESQSVIEALSRASEAVVGVQVQAVEGARSAQTLGARRSGSGVVIGADGLILTIGYLLIEAQSITITTPEGKRVPGRTVAYDLATGFGMIRPLLPVSNLKQVTLGSLRDLPVGQALMVGTGGQGEGGQASVAMTHLVSKRAFSGFWEYHIDLAAFTSPPVDNHSGAPLFNQRGELVGVGSLVVMDALGDARRLPGNMFVPLDLLRPILPELLSMGSSALSRRPWLGLNSSDQGGRIQVLRVNADSPAQAAGLKPGDVVLEVEGMTVNSLESFYKRIWDRPGTEVDIELTVLQGAEVRKMVLRSVDRLKTMLKPAGI